VTPRAKSVAFFRLRFDLRIIILAVCPVKVTLLSDIAHWQTCTGPRDFIRHHVGPEAMTEKNGFHYNDLAIHPVPRISFAQFLLAPGGRKHRGMIPAVLP
jgi:hypothetical protein